LKNGDDSVAGVPVKTEVGQSATPSTVQCQ
jgi:hypothetical protein